MKSSLKDFISKYQEKEVSEILNSCLGGSNDLVKELLEVREIKEAIYNIWVDGVVGGIYYTIARSTDLDILEEKTGTFVEEVNAYNTKT